MNQQEFELPPLAVTPEVPSTANSAHLMQQQKAEERAKAEAGISDEVNSLYQEQLFTQCIHFAESDRLPEYMSVDEMLEAAEKIYRRITGSSYEVDTD